MVHLYPFCGDVRGQSGLWCWAVLLSSTLQPWLGAGHAMGGGCNVLRLLGWAELALCCVLSLSSLLQGFLYDLDKVRGISIPSPLSPPSKSRDVLLPAPLCLHCPLACGV